MNHNTWIERFKEEFRWLEISDGEGHTLDVTDNVLAFIQKEIESAYEQGKKDGVDYFLNGEALENGVIGVLLDVKKD